MAKSATKSKESDSEVIPLQAVNNQTEEDSDNGSIDNQRRLPRPSEYCAFTRKPTNAPSEKSPLVCHL